MTEKYAGRFRRQLQPISRIVQKPQRSRSISNILEREPKLQPIRILERHVSVATNLNGKPAIEKRSGVAQLIEQFEKSKSIDNVHGSIKNSQLSLSSARYTPVPTSSDNTRTSLPKQKKESTEPLPQPAPVPGQPPPSPQSKIETITRPISYSISNNSEEQTACDTNQSNIPSDSHTVLSERTLSQSMTVLPQHPPSVSREFIKWQSNDRINNTNEDDSDSLDENKTIFLERLKEVYATEVTYVKTLYVLSIKLPAVMNETCAKDKSLIETFNKVYKPLLDTIQQLYKFHYEIILPHIRLYKTDHRTDNIWSILQEHFQTIEDLYKAYYIVYDEYQRELKRFEKSDALKKIHKAMLICKVYLGNLCPITEFNCPNQRLLRYLLLMKSSMKYLDENSSEYEHTSFIHDELTRIAIRCEEQLFISSGELNRLKGRIDNKPECFENQQFIWHGSLKKQTPQKRKRNDVIQLYVILFSECILVCEESGNKLEIKRQLSIENITVDIIDARQIGPTISHSTIGQQSTANVYYPFRVNATEKSYEFLGEKELDREKWVNKIIQANEDLKNRRSITGIHQSFRLSDKQEIGIRAPVWVYDIDVTRCQICNHNFGLKLMSSGRHHCRSCGRCICGSCSTKKLILKYRRKDGEVRICDTCYTLATGINRQPISSLKTTRNPNKTLLFGNFRSISSNSIVWIDLVEDHQLHIYSGKLDQVEDYFINLPELRDMSLMEETRTFILNGKEKRYKFSLELNHQIIYQKNDYIDENIKNRNNKPLFYAKLWYDTMQLARLKTLPLWYIRKRDSADSGISAVE